MSADEQAIASIRETAMQQFRQDPTHFPLLALPLELSQKVYQEVFRDGMVTFYSRRMVRGRRIMGGTFSIMLAASRPSDFFKSPTHKNLLLTSPTIYREAINIYWRSVLVVIPRTPHLMVVLREPKIAEVRHLQLNEPFDANYLLRDLPNMKTLHMTRKTDVRQDPSNPRMMTASEAESVWRNRCDELFPAASIILQRFPKIHLTCTLTVYFHPTPIPGKMPTRLYEVSIKSLFSFVWLRLPRLTLNSGKCLLTIGISATCRSRRCSS